MTKIRTTVVVDEEILKEFKKMAIDEDKKFSELLQEAMVMMLKKR